MESLFKIDAEDFLTGKSLRCDGKLLKLGLEFEESSFLFDFISKDGFYKHNRNLISFFYFIDAIFYGLLIYFYLALTCVTWKKFAKIPVDFFGV